MQNTLQRLVKSGGKVSKYIVLGGAGDMGSNAMRYLYKLLGNNGKNITVGDYRVDIAKEKAKKIDSEIDSIKIDANNHNELVNILKSYDVLINCIGPNFKYATLIANAAIDANINGVDICDDSDPTMDLFNLNEKESRCNDIIYIYGCGWTPGLTNICSKRASEILDSIHTLSIAWTGDPSSEGLAVVEHTLKIMTGDVPSFQNGKIIHVPATKGITRYEFPEVGRARVFDVAHPEPVTLPKYIKGLREVTLKGGLVPHANNMWLINNFIKTGKTSSPEKIHESALEIKKLTKNESLEGFISSVPSTFRVEALGEKDGNPISIIFSAAGGMDELTSLPAALAAVMIGEGKIKERGLLPPEACIPSEEFIQRFQEFGPKITIKWID